MPTREQLQQDAERLWRNRDAEVAATYLKFHTPIGKKERDATWLASKLNSELSEDENKTSAKPFK